MATKIARAWDDDDVMPTSTHIRIRGLKAVAGEDGLFELQGVKPRTIDHELLAKALGYEPDSEPELEEKVLGALWKFDMTRLLVDRIEC